MIANYLCRHGAFFHVCVRRIIIGLFYWLYYYYYSASSCVNGLIPGYILHDGLMKRQPPIYPVNLFFPPTHSHAPRYKIHDRHLIHFLCLFYLFMFCVLLISLVRLLHRPVSDVATSRRLSISHSFLCMCPFVLPPIVPTHPKYNTHTHPTTHRKQNTVC